MPTKDFRKKVDYNLKDENHASKMYSAMSRVAPTKSDREALRIMARQEGRHHKKLLVIKSHLKKRRK